MSQFLAGNSRHKLEKCNERENRLKETERGATEVPITMVQEADAVVLEEATAAEQHFQRRLASANNRRERAHATAAISAIQDARDEAQAGANGTQLLHAARRVNRSPPVSAPAAEGGQVAEAGSMGRRMKSQFEQASKLLRGGDTEIANMELSRSDHVMTREQQQKHRDMQEEMLAIQQQRAGRAIHESNPDDVRHSLSSLSPLWECARKHSAALIRTPPHSPPHAKKKSPEDFPKNNFPLAAHTTDFFDRGTKEVGVEGGGVKE